MFELRNSIRNQFLHLKLEVTSGNLIYLCLMFVRCEHQPLQNCFHLLTVRSQEWFLRYYFCEIGTSVLYALMISGPSFVIIKALLNFVIRLAVRLFTPAWMCHTVNVESWMLSRECMCISLYLCKNVMISLQN